MKLDEGLKLLGAVVGAVAGIVAIFTFAGFIITLGFISELGLYGIPKFPEEFFKEAGAQFFSDFINVLGMSWLHFPAFILLIVTLLLLAIRTRNIITVSRTCDGSGKSRRERMREFVTNNWPIILFLLLMSVSTSVILRLDHLIDEANNEGRGSVFFLLTIPSLVALGIYLVLHIAEIAQPREWRKNSYGAFLILFIVLLVCVPLEYGRFIYDVPVYFIQRIDCDPGYRSDLLKTFSDEINGRGTGDRIYYLMGHTSGKEVLFRSEEPPAQLVLFDSEAVKFINLASEVREKPMTLRTVLRKIPGKGTRLGGQKLDLDDPILLKLTK